MIELAMVLAVAVLLMAMLLPAARRARTNSGLGQSVSNLQQIMVAAIMYHFDHAGQAPMHASRYSNGQLSAWDTWSNGGKNCDVYWMQSQPLFDDSAYSRPLNAYLQNVRIPRPPNYVNTGSGSTWTFNSGTPTAAQRAGLQIGVFQSPGDHLTRERQWPTANTTISLYNDVGCSYITNMAWWGQPGYPPSFTAMYNEGTRRVGLAFDGANPNYVFMGDGNLDYIPYNAQYTAPGEFGKANASVCGFVDGRVIYLGLTPGAVTGPGYTLLP
jgi:hypothetical protein